ncbi:hypothetical protein A2130_00305 [Candidatus Woesebacteria bacterium GWC2_33_12]|uniref:Phosphoenolpyruvate synthase n=1 Tax=Candidatus Woesebacteria bacterium GW2011_GWB1_33_22 TaxID=1618566 RepID=A0A0F9ZL28_9BACT|nr:MAG: Phosphoenolpyruvate synthase [Candidatus Woesebacteria bacterium GW2011_GWC2_33_12]KKP42076.1 MAG: Phosphoenolpyruvate synthase [Candidatus Woesebacteria bacterium GW2011_GWA2_33_20]KKP44774.1 MAG: Phosphoenolpyruvate synthase [Candidatus Woesebacteria bacterium GW2011_GWB1_33_22]KKP46593.1 MAG: Phosphoenolpyruvate synthase [Microgenomates group bacterium GW2011_GWC1_33_28]KKP50506.1 MAG: Phosphoenolpyruvate synthase [Candidatus Woesebacteria bacterium GW2011_GWA1_33_33]OGM07662.1 MAG:
MKSILKFTDEPAKQVSLSGGKGSSLAHMTQFGIPVPPGFIVSSEVYESVVDNAKVKNLFKGIDTENLESVNNISTKLQQYIMSIEIPEDIINEIFRIYDELNLSLVAVRSSATSEDTIDASWAGELKTFLNTPKEQILQKVKECWTSLFSPRAILYKYEKGFQDKDIYVSVVVQEMIQSEVSGVSFTIHPVTMRKTHLLMDAVYGLGEAIVSGEVTPDSYLYDKDYDVLLKVEKAKQTKTLSLDKKLKGIMWEELPKNLQEKQKLDYKQILELAHLCKKVEAYYGKPQDIEWSYWGNSFYIIQSRPITTL